MSSTGSPCQRTTAIIEVVDDGGTGSDKVKVGYGNSLAITGDTAVIAYLDADRASVRIARIDISRLIERGLKARENVEVLPPAG